MNINLALSTKHWKIVGIGALALIVFGAVLFGIDKCNDWREDRGTRKEKEKIANTVREIRDIDARIDELEKQKAEKTGEIKRDLENLANKTFGLDEAKTEANQALANFANAVNANANINRSAEDLNRILEKLDN